MLNSIWSHPHLSPCSVSVCSLSFVVSIMKLIMTIIAMNLFTNSQFWEIIHFCAFSIVTLTVNYCFMILQMPANSFSKLMQCAAGKSNTTCTLLALCPGYRLFTPNLLIKSECLSLLNIAFAGIVPGTHTLPLPLWTIPCSFCPPHSYQACHHHFLGIFQVPWNITQDFRFIILQTWKWVALCIPR